jgi:uncharacterized protein
MTLHVLRCDAVAPQPWKNGGGLTRELLAWPAGEAWSLRLSVADIRADGPFSAFPGVDRWFAVLEGAGVLLTLPDGKHTVQADGTPVHFRGEAAPPCELLDGPTRDLNLMIQRDAGRGAMQRAQPGEDFGARDTFRALFTADPLTLQIDGADAARVPAMALLWADGSAQSTWRVAADTPPRAWWIHFQPRPA